MRTRTIGLALLLMAGIVLATGSVKAQEYAPPDPVWPIPTGSARPEQGGLYTISEFAMFRQTNPLRHQTIAVRGLIDQTGAISGTPGAFFGSGATALDARQAGGPGTYQPGFNIGLGWRFRDGSAAEVSWMHLTKSRYFAVASLIGEGNAGFGSLGFQPGADLENTFLTSPVFNFPLEYAGPANDFLNPGTGQPATGAGFGIWIASDNQTIELTQRTEQIQGKYRVPIWETDSYRCYGLVGLRFFWIWEGFKWRVVDADINGNASSFDVAQYTNIVSNRMYGPFVGFGQDWYIGSNMLGAYSISLDLEAAMLLDVVKQRAKYELGEKFAPPQVKRSITDYKGVPELSASLRLWWYPIESIQVSLGWDAMAFFNTIAARNPVDFNFGGLDPAWERVPIRFFDGLRVGMSISF